MFFSFVKEEIIEKLDEIFILQSSFEKLTCYELYSQLQKSKSQILNYESMIFKLKMLYKKKNKALEFIIL